MLPLRRSCSGLPDVSGLPSLQYTAIPKIYHFRQEFRLKKPCSHPQTPHALDSSREWEFSLWKHLVIVGAAGAMHMIAAAADEVPSSWRGCFTQAGMHYGIAPALLTAIARTESKLDPSAIHLNADGSSDVGVMQVNSRWFPTLRRAGIEPKALYQPCPSIWAGAWILAQSFARHGYTWESIGAYNAGERLDPSSTKRRAAYANQVLRNLAYSTLEQQLHNAPHGTGVADYSLEGPDGRGPGGADQ